MTDKAIPIGYEDFQEIIERNCYYVDKSNLIKELIDTQSKVILFTRPRRFGKTLNQSMLRYFFEKTDNDTSSLFQGLKISGYDGKYMKYQGQYPVISVTFKSLGHASFEDTYKAFQHIISDEFKRHIPILESDALLDTEKAQYMQIVNQTADKVDYKFSLGFLSNCLKKVYQQDVIILIDEYDVPLESAYFHGFYSEMVDLIRSTFEKVLKTNSDLHMAVLTGCLRISKESIFTGLNNLDVYDVTNEQFSQYFGFTTDEVQKLLSDYDIPEHEAHIKEWYDGYLFGTTEIYNPFSVVCYVNRRISNDPNPAQKYWSNTSANNIVKELAAKCNDETREQLELLTNGTELEKPIYKDLTYGDLESVNSEQIWSHLLFTGYLKQKYNPETDKYILTIPNKEVRDVYIKTIKEAFKERLDSNSRDDLFRAILEKDTATAMTIINDWIYEAISYHDEKESFYHGTMLGLLSGWKGYKLESNREAGTGRFDLMLYDAKRRSIGIAFEFKLAASFDDMDAKIDEALHQIQEMDYTQFFRSRDISNIIRYGVAFCNKRCKMKVIAGE